MTILCIETSTSVCSAAICLDGKPYKQCICREGSNHARLLPRYIEELLRFATEQNLSIDAVALSEGPGSYTGLRIGTSTAKGLCYGMDIPLIPVPTLQVLACAAKAKMTNDQLHVNAALLCPMIDARRMEVYSVFYDYDLQPQSSVRAVIVESENSLLSDNTSVCYFGDGAAKCTGVIQNPDWHFVPDIVPEAQYMGILAEQIASRQASITSEQPLITNDHSLAYYEPFYLKDFIAAQSHVKGLKS